MGILYYFTLQFGKYLFDFLVTDKYTLKHFCLFMTKNQKKS